MSGSFRQPKLKPQFGSTAKLEQGFGVTARRVCVVGASADPPFSLSGRGCWDCWGCAEGLLELPAQQDLVRQAGVHEGVAYGNVHHAELPDLSDSPFRRKWVVYGA